MEKNSSGQILLITLLVLTVGMTIALSLLQRQQKNLTISNDVEESARAFSAAEAGIEEALKTGQETGSNPQPLSEGSPNSYTTNVNQIGAGTAPYAFPQVTTQGETETVWLANHAVDGTLVETGTFSGNTLDICWKGSATPALSIIVLYKHSGVYQTARGAFDPNNIRTNTNKFTYAGAAVNACGQVGVYRRQLQFNTLGITPGVDALLAVRLRPVYADASLYVDSLGSTLPSQGSLVESSGTTGTGVTRKIVVNQQFRSAPSIFDAAIFSQQNFSH